MANHRAARSQSVGIGRRPFLRLAFFGALGTAAVGSGAGLVTLLYPRSPGRFGSLERIEAAEVPKPGAEPVLRDASMRFWLVNLRAGEGRAAGGSQSSDGGLFALSARRTHLGCTLPWRQDYVREGQAGWFVCPCHTAIYSKAGVRVYGPAPRSMDRFPVSETSGGAVVVDTSRRILGHPDGVSQFPG